MVGRALLEVHPLKPVKPAKKAPALLAVALLVGVLLGSACSKKDETVTPVLPDGVKLPTEQGGSCKDPVADITGDIKGGAGTLAEPSGIDIVAAESKVVDGVLKSKLTMAGAIASAPAPTIIIDQGNPGQEVSFELRAAPDRSGTWVLTLVTWKGAAAGGISERSAPLTGSSVLVDDKTISFDIPTKDLPPIVTLLWNFGASSGDGDAALLDDCNSVTEQVRGDPGTSTTSSTTTVPNAALGAEQPWKTTSRITVFEVQSPPTTPKVLAVEPDPGFKLAVVRAQVCATDSRIDARTQNFNVKLVTNELYPIWSQPQAGADPAMPVSQSLPPGECIRGFITFQIPADAQVAQVLYSGASDGRDAIVWKVA